LIEIINKPLLLHLVGYLYYWQMGFNSVFKGLNVCVTEIRWVFGVVLYQTFEVHEMDFHITKVRT